MGQEVTVSHAKLGTRMKKNQNGTRHRPSRQNRSSLQLLLASKMIVLGAATVFILISMYTNLTSLQFFWLEQMPSLWRLMCGLFTPRNLFIVLNLLILSILALAHLHNSTSAPTLLSAAVDHSHNQHPINDHDCSNVKLNDADHVDGGADDLQQGGTKFDVYHAEPNSGAGQSPTEMKLIMDDDHADNADQCANDANHALKRWKEDDKRDEEALATAPAAASLVMEEAIAESTFRVHLSAVYKEELYCSKHAERGEAGKAPSPVGGKAEKTTIGEADWQGLGGVDDALIDSLLSEEGSIFTRAESRPLASARFTRNKKGSNTANHDRQLSPLRISKPILKRGETLEATWKAICESKRQSSPFNRHFSKHSASERIHDGAGKPRSSFLSPIKQRSKAASRLHDHELTRAQVQMRKSREPSMPHEELNAKVESFISRFNAQIRIQREKSLLDYMEMVGRGAS